MILHQPGKPGSLPMDDGARWTVPVPFPYLDLHSHVLPGVDDGCETLAESLKIVRDSIALGCRVLACTPHMGVDRYADNTPAIILGAVEQLRQAIAHEGLEIELIAAGEFRLTIDSIAWLRRHGVPTLGSGNHVLIDTWSRSWEPEFDDAIQWLFDQGYQPVLAHPERMKLEDEVWYPLIESLLQRQVLLQGNFKSFGPDDQERVRQRGWSLLEQKAYHLLAGDLHGPASFPARVSGLAALFSAPDDHGLEQLLVDRPAALLQPSTPRASGD